MIIVDYMPYKILLKDKKYRLLNLSTKKLSKVKFKSKKTALKQSQNYMRYEKSNRSK
jgi:hypothetical protein